MSETNTNATQVPSFLKVLCILTWVGSGIGLITGIIGLMATSSVSSLDYGNSTVNSALGAANTIQYVNLICVILCIVGAVMMWQLKKAGFFIYIVGELVPLIASLILLGGLSSVAGPFGGAMAAGAFIGALFPIAFIVMYALNLKHLK
jgi:hypothetical protein